MTMLKRLMTAAFLGLVPGVALQDVGNAAAPANQQPVQVEVPLSRKGARSLLGTGRSSHGAELWSLGNSGFFVAQAGHIDSLDLALAVHDLASGQIVSDFVIPGGRGLFDLRPVEAPGSSEFVWLSRPRAASGVGHGGGIAYGYVELDPETGAVGEIIGRPALEAAADEDQVTALGLLSASADGCVAYVCDARQQLTLLHLPRAAAGEVAVLGSAPLPGGLVAIVGVGDVDGDGLEDYVATARKAFPKIPSAGPDSAGASAPELGFLLLVCTSGGLHVERERRPRSPDHVLGDGLGSTPGLLSGAEGQVAVAQPHVSGAGGLVAFFSSRTLEPLWIFSSHGPGFTDELGAVHAGTFGENLLLHAEQASELMVVSEWGAAANGLVFAVDLETREVLWRRGGYLGSLGDNDQQFALGVSLCLAGSAAGEAVLVAGGCSPFGGVPEISTYAPLTGLQRLRIR